MIHTIVLDFDGTLVDSNEIKRQGFLSFACADNGGEAKMRKILNEVSGDRTFILSAYLQEIIGRPCEDGELSDALQSYNDMVDAAVVSASEMFGASNFLATLRHEGIKLILSSATPEKNLLDIVARRGWLDMFDMVFGSPRDKIATLKSLISPKTSASQLAVVGDGQDDRNSAREIGCRFFPVGEARGITAGEKIYTLPEICSLLSGEIKKRAIDHA